MPSKDQKPHNAVSFSTFRRMQILAVKRLWSCLWTCESVPDEAHFLVWALLQALEEQRFADAVAISRTLSEQQYGDNRSYRVGAQIVALVKKVPFMDPDLDPELKARIKFLQAEADCGEVNAVMRAFRFHMNGASYAGAFPLEVSEDSVFISRLLVRAKSHIRRVLGATPDIKAILSRARFGSGSSVGVHGNATHFLRKITAEMWSVSPLCLPYARAAAAAQPAFWYALGLEPSQALHLWEDPLYHYAEYAGEGSSRIPNQDELLREFSKRFTARVTSVSHDLITYVPKDADCHRTVGTQPLLNSFCQLGAGDYLAEVLRDRCGIDLSTGQDHVNGPLAFLGSYCDGTTLSTLDLASASDTISKELVHYLLPEAWYSFLNALRTPSFFFPEDAETTPYQKFCAMGNGFCFPLETLVFWSLAQAVYDVVEVPDRLMAVYGDDIIVYQPAALLLIELLQACGFETNNSKTFVFGPFRESCGQDYFNGVNVRPVVLDEVIEGLGQAYHFINSLNRKGYSALATELRELLPSDRIHMRPYPGDTTTALEVPMDVFMASRHARFRRDTDRPEVPFYAAWSWVELMPTPINDEREYDGKCHLSAALAGATACDYSPVFAYRRKTRVRVREVAHG